ncbi:tyrosine-protein phosphatase [Haloferula rosea]|uniref:Tyrosine-protein phosphatase n=1 Tax=Haloferula rosea TaxID=490093 RepID=A0A934VF28_9BACT|nr:tyrosine-protein phosphatase [Haloferula rosea]MBK1826636.1 tyrosine-protein phosphatase [Haloferula rosea]
MILVRSRAFLAAVLALALAACSGVNQLHRVDDRVWRSGQPTAEEFDQIEQEKRIQRVLNLRFFHSDDRLAPDWERHHVRMNAGTVGDDEIFEALRVLTTGDGPTLVHCLHGSDRTGVVVAAYRMVVQGWSRDRAMEEFTDPEYGYHEFWYPNLEKYLQEFDIEGVRERLRDANA